jgi:hypothetical protein
MPRFFFHLRDPRKRLTDCEGTVLADAAAARTLANLTARDFFRPATNRIDAGYEDGSIEVSDDRGRIIFGLAIADAIEPYEPDTCLLAKRETSHGVVYLGAVRARRDFAVLQVGLRALRGHTTQLVDHSRYACNTLRHVMKETEQVRARSQEVLARSRRQASGYNGWAAHAAG